MALPFTSGHVLARRYRILESLGAGRTVAVYLAEDLSLQRRVVVKVLLAELAEHEEVRRAFRDHIVRASTLSHPHLARVFDGGQESGEIFMISEYLAGGALEDVLGSGQRFSVDEGARLGRDVASALGYVHEHGFVLGSLSPSKLLFDDEGRVRVSDVALAGLATGYRERMSLDDARYLSPEQAIGEPATAKSDVYALALILFEAVTGAVAFEGSTPESVLRARLNTPLPVRLELGTLDMVLAQAAVPDARLRLDAEQLSARLGAVVGDAAPLVVRWGREPLPLLAKFTPHEPRNSIGFRAPSADQIARAPMGAAGGFPRAPRGSSSLGTGGAHARQGPPSRTPRFDGLAGELPRASRRPRWGFLAAALVIVLGAVGAGAAWKLGVFTRTHAVPSLIGLSLRQASTTLEGDGFSVSVVGRVHSSRVPAGDIVTQSPATGVSAKAGVVIAVSVSEGPVLVPMPNLLGETCANATAKLLALHVTAQCPSSAAIFSTTRVNGVARVLYNETANPLEVPAGSTVVLSLSKGPNPASTTTTTSPGTTTTAPLTSTTTTTLAGAGLRAVPNVVGDNQAQVYAAMKAALLYYKTVGPNSNSTKWTTVVSQSPVAGTMVKAKSTVVLTVK